LLLQANHTPLPMSSSQGWEAASAALS
jgi:hypothetical protein